MVLALGKPRQDVEFEASPGHTVGTRPTRVTRSGLAGRGWGWEVGGMMRELGGVKVEFRGCVPKRLNKKQAHKQKSHRMMVNVGLPVSWGTK